MRVRESIFPISRDLILCMSGCTSRLVRVARGVPEDKVRRFLPVSIRSPELTPGSSGTPSSRYAAGPAAPAKYCRATPDGAAIGNYTCDEAWWRFRGAASFCIHDGSYGRSNSKKMWEEDLEFPGSRYESGAIIDTTDPQHPPTPPHTDSSHSSEFSPIVDSFAASSPRPLAVSYSLDDLTTVRRSMGGEPRSPPHVIPSPNARTSWSMQTTERPPMNPHDHSLLEVIYNEMHAARFINLDPLSLLTNLLPLHFKGPSIAHASPCT